MPKMKPEPNEIRVCLSGLRKLVLSRVSKRFLETSSFPGKSLEPIVSFPGIAASLSERHIPQCLLPSHCHEEFINCMTTLQKNPYLHTHFKKVPSNPKLF